MNNIDICYVLFVVVGGFGLLAGAPLAGAGATPGTATDTSLYPKAYGVLANEKVMYPVDMSDWPIRIDASHQLFVDDYLIASSTDLKRTVHQVRKYEGNPIMADHKPWEVTGPAFQIVRRDPDTGRFRMWYTSGTRLTLPGGITTVYPAMYAESEDGITWQRPNLGLVEYEGSRDNNIIIAGGNLFGLHIDDDEPDRQRRYKGIAWHNRPYVEREGYYLYGSPDGIHWKRARTEPLAISLKNYTLPQSGIGDTTIFRWDPYLRKYIGDVKFVVPPKMRCRGIMESDDLIHWSRPRMTIYPDSLDDADSQIYGHLSFRYESMWLAFLRVMHTERTVRHKQTTVELSASRDGRHWYRVGNREEVIPLGSEADWDTDYHDPSPDPIPVGDELWIYYRSAKLLRDTKRRWDLGLAMVRRDGFASLDAGRTPGHVVTRPMNFQGKKLMINAEVADGGYVKVAALTPKNEPVKDHAPTDALPVTKGSLAVPVAWKNTNELTVAPDDHLRLAFELKSARLYSFWIE